MNPAKILDPAIKRSAPAVVLSVIELRARLHALLMRSAELPAAMTEKDRSDMAGIATSSYLVGLALSCLSEVVADPDKRAELFKQICGDTSTVGADIGGPRPLVGCLAAVCD